MDADAVSLRAVGEFVDAEHRPKRLYGNGPPFDPERSDIPSVRKVAYCWNQGCDIDDVDSWVRYVVYDGTADDNAYDLGMANRLPEGLPSGVDFTQKGLVESHRWISPADGYRTRRQAQQPGEDGTPEPPTPGVPFHPQRRGPPRRRPHPPVRVVEHEAARRERGGRPPP